MNLVEQQFNSVQDVNQYPDNTSKRSHLKSIEAAIAYLDKKSTK